MSHKPRKVGWVARLTALAGAALLVLSGAQTASAAEPLTVDPAKQGSLNIHKFEQPEDIGGEGDGTQQDTTGLTPIGGIGFTVKLIDRTEVDLATNAGWQKVAGLNGDVNQATALGFDATQPAPDELFTDANGDAVFSNLPVGLYLVTETTSNGYTPAVPFIVTVPITDPENLDNWLYDVHLYPKNSKGNTKTAEDSESVKLGDVIDWSIRGDIPRGGTLSGYQVADTLDSRLEYMPTAEVSLANADAVSLAAEDYVIDFIDSTDHPKYLAGKYEVNTVLVTFTKTGLVKLEEAGKASGTSQVQVDIKTKVISLGDGVITNSAVIYPDGPSVDWTPGDPENPENPGTEVPGVTSKWGNIVFTKTDDEGNSLKGAEFQVFLTEADARAKTNPIGIVMDADGNPIDPPQTTFVSDDSGEVRITGLRYSTWANGVEVKPGDVGYQSYWLAETKAPEGFTLLAEPIQVEVNSLENPVVVSGAEGNNDDKLENVVNVPNNGGFELPKTGGAGTWFLTAGSILLALGAAAMLIRRVRGNSAS